MLSTHKIPPFSHFLLAGIAATLAKADTTKPKDQKPLTQSEITQQAEDSIRKILEGCVLDSTTKEFILTDRALRLVEEESKDFKNIRHATRIDEINFCKIERVKDLLAKIIQEYKSRPQLEENLDLEILEEALDNKALDSFTIFVKDKDSGLTTIYICLGENIYKSNDFAQLLGEVALQVAIINKHCNVKEKDKTSTTTKTDKDIAGEALATLENILKNHRGLDTAVVNQLKFNVIPKAKQRVQQSGTKTFTLVLEVVGSLVVLAMVIAAFKLTYDLAKDKKYRTEETKVVGRRSAKPPTHTIKHPDDINTAHHIKNVGKLMQQQKKPDPKTETTKRIKK